MHGVEFRFYHLMGLKLFKDRDCHLTYAVIVRVFRYPPPAKSIPHVMTRRFDEVLSDTG